nr:TonB-system energizer ExbB [Deltaproteobacteria bacterium]
MQWLSLVIDWGIIGILILLSIVALAIAVERYLVYRHIRLKEYGDRKSLELEVTRKLHLIATIGSNAPYIGLLG